MVENLPAWAILWYSFLCTLAAVNVTRYILVCWWAYKESQSMSCPDSETKWYTFKVRWLAAPYVFICAYRSIFPNNYPDRTVWWDTPLSSILLMRCLAAIAELCFVVQLASSMSYCSHRLCQVMPGQDQSRVGDVFENRMVQRVARFMVFVIICAQTFSCTGTITACALFYACEESCWGLAFFAAFSSFLSIFFRARRLRRGTGRRFRFFVEGSRAWSSEAFAACLSLFCAVYVVGIYTMDVPAWATVYKQQVEVGARWFDFSDGIQDAAHRRVETHDFSVWSYTIVWQSLYFLFGVHLSIECAWGPRPDIADNLPVLASANSRPNFQEELSSRPFLS